MLVDYLVGEYYGIQLGKLMFISGIVVIVIIRVNV